MDGKIDDNVRISKTGIVFSSKDQSQYDFPYDQVYTNRQEFIRYAYSTSVSPLVQNAIQGESVMMVFGGVPSSDINQYLLSSPAPSTPQSGLICQAADEMLSAIPRPEGNEKIGSVTFSWYRIDTNTSELLTDVLKAASAKTNVPSNDTASSLVLREAGKGRGMVVPGVWEVEIANGSDIEAVVAHVSKVIPQVADHSNGSAHTVMSLTMNLKNVPPPPAGIQSPSAISADNPGVGRISFLLLSQLNSPPGKATTASTSTSSRYAWVEQLEAISQWVDSRHSSPPFHKSRLMLLIKDAFLRRQKSAFMLLLQPLANPAVSYLNFQWLKIGKLFCRDSPKIPFPGEDEMKTLQSNTQANSMTSNNMKRVPSQSKLADQQQPSKERSGSNGRGSRSSTPVNGNTTNVTAPPSQPQQHSSNRSSRTSSRDEFDYTSLQQAGEFNEPKVAEYIPPPPPHHFSSQIQGHTNSRPPSRNSSPPIYNNPTMQATGNASTPDHYKTATEPPNYLYDDSYMDSSPMPRQFPSRQNSSNSQAPGIAPQHQQPQHYAQSMSAAQPTLPNNNANTNWNNNNNNNQPRFAQTSNAALGMNRAAPQPVAGLQHTMPIPQPNNPPKRASSAPRGSNVAAVNSNVIPVPIHNNNNNNYISGGNSVAGDSVGFSYLEDMGYHEVKSFSLFFMQYFYINHAVVWNRMKHR